MAADDQATPQSRSFLRPPVWMILLILVLLGFALFGDKGIINTLRMHQYKESLRDKIDELETDNARLRREIEALRNDHRYLESLARRELGMVKDDELVYQFPSSSRPVLAPAAENPAER
jgi:cell division protein FtsB